MTAVVNATHFVWLPYSTPLQLVVVRCCPWRPSVDGERARAFATLLGIGKQPFARCYLFIWQTIKYLVRARLTSRV